MATTAKTIRIVKTPGVRGGKACVDGSRICVLDVVSAHKAGLQPEEIQVECPDRNLAQIHAAALSYYYANTEEIEAEIRQDEKWEEGFGRRKAEYLRRARTIHSRPIPSST